MHWPSSSTWLLVGLQTLPLIFYRFMMHRWLYRLLQTMQRVLSMFYLVYVAIILSLSSSCLSPPTHTRFLLLVLSPEHLGPFLSLKIATVLSVVVGERYLGKYQFVLQKKLTLGLSHY